MAWVAQVLWKSFGCVLLYLNDLAVRSQVRFAIFYLHSGCLDPLGGDCRIFRAVGLKAYPLPDLSLPAGLPDGKWVGVLYY